MKDKELTKEQTFFANSAFFTPFVIDLSIFFFKRRGMSRYIKLPLLHYSHLTVT